MKNVFNLFTRYYHFFLFIILQGVCLVMIVSSLNYHKSGFTRVTGTVSGWLFEIRNSFTEPFVVKKHNTQLMEENAMLLNHMPQAYRSVYNGDILIDSLSLEREFSYVPARVIDISLNRVRNFITIDRGRKDGIRKEMGVISNSGIVGFVYEVSDHYSIIVPVQSDLFSTSVKLGGTNDFGTIKWETDNPDFATVRGISASRELFAGDRFLTKGASARFPEGIPVGEIDAFELEPGRSDYTISLKLATDFRALYHVYVINPEFRNELDSLDQAKEELDE
jgi:rod shape-determining protein MreC